MTILKMDGHCPVLSVFFDICIIIFQYKYKQMARNKSKGSTKLHSCRNTIFAQLTHFRHGENLDFELLKDVKSFLSFDPYT